jgi:sialate O-acetylesterase
MIRNWRELWGQGCFPFAWVQLPNFRAAQKEPIETTGWVIVQEQMLKTLAVANTGMAITIDVGEADDIHPKNKQDVGKRLALWALGTTYGKDVVPSGPIYKSMRKQNGTIVLEFDHVGDGLVARGDKLQGFAIAGEDRQFVFADAEISGNTVLVSSPAVKDPVAVRYAWAPNPNCNLYNSAGLPASPFRTDEWEK